MQINILQNKKIFFYLIRSSFFFYYASDDEYKNEQSQCLSDVKSNHMIRKKKLSNLLSELSKCPNLIHLYLNLYWKKTNVNNPLDQFSSENKDNYQSFSLNLKESFRKSLKSYYILYIKSWFNQLLMFQKDIFFGLNQLDNYSHFEISLG
ncbi:hypothetical protein TTHERM_002653327 (macronuclear) [Tetrahymena thermophila SB210]|uniref:Uncharacterized protein n=1 Tax=Tetrahymena thermophila (strain SB210) TaxID=312017 RepID=W7XI21_TETTS|nr:hypothetical protein TTHERM_002653327 [Tetrahymena thermophila SB210]EWS74271.1 hypothetical protein TTHERM_002653327 [Tetrahymena thermophila SB210]|eukprot:XP_012653195.1 hypothetical protein TTHERM_002653327 [Tetrahymena thermophila SB210]